MQEVAVARRLLIICGDKGTEGSYFARLHGRIRGRIHGEELKARIEQLSPLLEYIYADSTEHYSKPELLTLLQRFRPWNASVPHDKIYALRGLSHDGPNAPELEPDYKLSADALYEKVAKHVISRYNSLAVLMYVGARSPSNSVSQGLWMSWLQAQFFVTSNHQLPTWCPDWRDSYTPLKSEPVSKPNINLSLPDHFAMLDAEDGSDTVLRVSGFVVAFVASIPHGSFDIGLPPNVKERVKDIPDTCYQLSQHLHEANALLKKSNARAIEKGDQICVLNGFTGIAILRPSGSRFKLVLREHTDFEAVHMDPFQRSSRPTSHAESAYGSVIKQIFFSLV